jgi:hypothetical protein
MAGLADVDKAMAAEAVVEGAVLARYRFSVAQHDSGTYLEALSLVCGDGDIPAFEKGPSAAASSRRRRHSAGIWRTARRAI